MRSRLRASQLAAALSLLGSTTAFAQSVAPVSIDSAVSINQFGGQNAAHRPDVVVDVTATMRLGKGWVAYVRPWFRKASTDPYEFAREIYQAAVQHQRSGRISTRVDLGYILSPIGLGMLDMRPDTNPLIMTHLSYVVPMPTFDPGAPPSLPVASSYPLGGQITASTKLWDARAAVVTSPPNRSYVLYASKPNPQAHPTAIVGGGVTPRTGLRVGLAYASGDYVVPSELTRPPNNARRLNMIAVEGEYSFAYTRIIGEVTRDSLGTATGHAVATQWFVQGVQSLTPRWFVAARHEGVNAPPRTAGAAVPTLRVAEITAGFHLSQEFTLRGAFVRRKTYFNAAASSQAGVSLVWARRWF